MYLKLTNDNDIWKNYDCFGMGGVKGGVVLGINSYSMFPSVSKTKSILKRKYGRPTSDEETGDGKVTFEYAFYTKYPGILFRIYDYKGSMSSGVGVMKNLTVTKEQAENINKDLEQFIKGLVKEEEDEEKH